MYACRQDLSNTSEAISSAGSGEIEAISSAGSPHFSCARQPRCSVLELLRGTQAWHMQHIYIYVYITIQIYMYTYSDMRVHMKASFIYPGAPQPTGELQ